MLSCVITEPPPPSCMTANSTELLALSIAAATFFSEHRSPVLGLGCGEKQRSNGGSPSRSVRGVQFGRVVVLLVLGYPLPSLAWLVTKRRSSRLP